MYCILVSTAKGWAHSCSWPQGPLHCRANSSAGAHAQIAHTHYWNIHSKLCMQTAIDRANRMAIRKEPDS